MKRSLLLLFWCVVLAAWRGNAGGAEGALRLAVRGEAPVYTLVLDAPVQAVRQGAGELQRVVRQAVGVELAVAESWNGRHIVLGYGERARQAGLSLDGIRADGYGLAVRGESLYIYGVDQDVRDFLTVSNSGHSQVGTYHGVLEVLERFLGVGWYMPGPLGEEIPEAGEFVVPGDLAVTDNPHFSERFLNTASGGSASGQRAYMERLQRQGLFEHLHVDEKAWAETAAYARHLRLGTTRGLAVAHAWHQWVPAVQANAWVEESYGQSHPEYYALRHGKRQASYRGSAHGGQLCVSNSAVAKVYAANVVRYARRTGERDFSLSDNDGGEHCECDGCLAMDPPGADGSLTDRLGRFANRVAELATVELADLRFGLYAYHSTRTPPVATTLHPSISISDVYNHLPHLYLQAEARGAMLHDLRGWRRSCSRVVLTTYYQGEGFWSFPWSTWKIQDWLLKELASSPASAGIRMNYCGPGNLAPVGISGADHYVFARLLWHPEQDAAALADAFYQGAFGPAAGAAVREYFELIDEAMVAAARLRPLEGAHVRTAAHGLPDFLDAYRRIRPACAVLVARAAAAVAGDTAGRQWRVDRVVRGWRYLELTLDAIALADAARQAAGVERQAAWERAIAAGQARMAFVLDRANTYAVAAAAVDQYNRYVPLGDVRELPAGEGLQAVPARVAGQPALDGTMGDAVWSAATLLEPFKHNRSLQTPEAATQVRVARTTDGLLVSFACQEPLMADLRPARDAVDLWSGDVVEFFFYPGHDTTTFVQYSVNPDNLGRVVCQRGDQGIDNTFAPAWRSAAVRRDDGWNVEMFIPWQGLLLDGEPTAGSAFYVNFFRERYAGGRTELSGWSPTGSSFNTPARFGRMLFKAGR